MYVFSNYSKVLLIHLLIARGQPYTLFCTTDELYIFMRVDMRAGIDHSSNRLKHFKLSLFPSAFYRFLSHYPPLKLWNKTPFFPFCFYAEI